METVVDNTLSLLRQKLENLEMETGNLAHKLQHENSFLTEIEKSLNESTSSTNNNIATATSEVYCTESKDKIIDTDDSLTDNGLLISRICRNESQLQSLKDKIDLLNKFKANLNLHRSKDYDGQVVELKKEFASKLSLLKTELQNARGDDTDNTSTSRKGNENTFESLYEQEICALRHTIEQLIASEANARGEVDQLISENAKLEKRLDMIRDEIKQEQSLRYAIEQSHNALLDQIHSTHVATEADKEEVRRLTAACDSIRSAAALDHQDLSLERDRRVEAEENCERLKKIIADRTSEVMQSQENVRTAEEEMRRLATQYDTLIKQLHEMEKIATQHAEVTTDVRGKNKKLIEALIQAVAEKDDATRERIELHQETAERNRLNDEILHELDATKRELQLIRDELDITSKEKDEHIARLERDQKQTLAQHEVSVKSWEDRFIALEEDNEKLRENCELVNAAHTKQIADLQEKRMFAESEVKIARLDLSAASESKAKLENEVVRLTERLSTLEQQMTLQPVVEETMHDMVRQKTQLAYEKGQLQTRIIDLECQVQNGARYRQEADQHRKTLSMLEVKYKKTQSAAGEAKLECKRLEGGLNQLNAATTQQAEELAALQRNYDEIISENGLLKEKLASFESCGKEKVKNLVQNLEATRADKKRTESTLESMMSSHSQMHIAMETLEAELSNRETVINQLHIEKSDLTSQVEQLRRDNDDIKKQVETLETLDDSEVQPLRKALELCRCDNKSMANTLEELLESNVGLQSSLNSLQIDLAKKDQLIEKLKLSKIKLGEETKSAFDDYDQRLTAFQKQLKIERDKSDRKSTRECTELRRQCDTLSSKNGELSRSNLDLRNRISDLETTLKDSKERNYGLKSQLDRVNSSKKRLEDNLTHFKALKTGIEELEKTKEEYAKKNEEQAAAIARLMTHISTLQQDLRTLSEQQTRVETLVAEKDEEIKRGTLVQSQLFQQYQERCDEQNEVERRRLEAEARLQEVSNESLEVSRHLEEAQNWFRTRFSHFEESIKKSQEKHDELEQKNSETNKKLETVNSQALLTASRAKKIIRATRATLEQLADYGVNTDESSRREIKRLYRHLEWEMGQRTTGLQEELQRRQETVGPSLS